MRYIDLQDQDKALNLGDNRFKFDAQLEYWDIDAQEYLPFRVNYYNYSDYRIDSGWSNESQCTLTVPESRKLEVGGQLEKEWRLGLHAAKSTKT